MAISKKKTIFTDQFLLESKMANKLYHNHVANLPIIDYHNHLPPNEIAENKKFKYSFITSTFLGISNGL